MAWVITSLCRDKVDMACVEVCPVDCCVPDPNNSESEDQLFKRAKEIHPDDGELQAIEELTDETSRFRAA